VFRETALSTPDLSGTDFTSLHEAYCASQADYTGKITVPVLWDRKLHGTEQIDLYPPALRSEIDALNLRTTRSVATGVYAVAGARDQAEYEETATICELLLAAKRSLVARSCWPTSSHSPISWFSHPWSGLTQCTIEASNRPRPSVHARPPPAGGCEAAPRAGEQPLDPSMRIL
jgi:hypothetical protein